MALPSPGWAAGIPGTAGTLGIGCAPAGAPGLRPGFGFGPGFGPGAGSGGPPGGDGGSASDLALPFVASSSMNKLALRCSANSPRSTSPSPGTPGEGRGE